MEKLNNKFNPLNILTLNIVFLLIFSIAHGQVKKILSIQECIDLGLKNNIGLLIADKNIQTAEINHRFQKQNWQPSLDLSSGFSKFWGRSIDPSTNAFTNNNIASFNISSGLSIKLYQGGMEKLILGQRENSIIIAELQKELSEKSLIAQITSLYLAVALATRTYYIEHENHQHSLNTLERSKALLSVGNTTQDDLLQIESQIKQGELRVLKSVNEYKLKKFELQQTIRYEDENFDINLSQINQVVFQKPQFDLSHYDLNKYPGIIKLDYDIKSFQLGYKIEGLRVGPSLRLNGRLSSSFSPDERSRILTTTAGINGGSPSVSLIEGDKIPFFENLQNKFNQSLGLSLFIPILNKSTARRNKLLIKNDIDRLILSKSDTMIEISNLIKREIISLENWYAEYDSALKALEASKISYESMQNKYASGAATFLELDDLKVKYYQAQNNTLLAKINFIFKRELLKSYDYLKK